MPEEHTEGNDSNLVRFDQLYIFLMEDEDGNEKVVVTGSPDQGFNPLFSPNEEDLESFRETARMVANGSGRTLKMVKLSVREVVEEIVPDPDAELPGSVRVVDGGYQFEPPQPPGDPFEMLQQLAGMPSVPPAALQNILGQLKRRIQEKMGRTVGGEVVEDFDMDLGESSSEGSSDQNQVNITPEGMMSPEQLEAWQEEVSRKLRGEDLA